MGSRGSPRLPLEPKIIPKCPISMCKIYAQNCVKLWKIWLQVAISHRFLKKWKFSLDSGGLTPKPPTKVPPTTHTHNPGICWSWQKPWLICTDMYVSVYAIIVYYVIPIPKEGYPVWSIPFWSIPAWVICVHQFFFDQEQHLAFCARFQICLTVIFWSFQGFKVF